MQFKSIKSRLIRSGLAASILLLGSAAAFAQSVPSASVALGTVNVGANAQANVTLTADTLPIDPNSVSATLASGAPFSVDATACTAGLAVLQTCTITVTFAPTATGTFNDSVTIIATTGAGTPVTITNSPISVSGTGVYPTGASVTSASVGLGVVDVGASAQTAVLTLTADALPIDAGSVSATLGTGAPFSVDATACAGGLTLGQTCAITVTLAPTATGTFTDSVTISALSSGSPITVTNSPISVSGKGVYPTVSPAASQLIFTDPGAGNTTKQTVTLSNVADTPVVFTWNLTVSGNYSLDSSSTCAASPTTLSGSTGTCTIVVAYTLPASAVETGAGSLTVTQTGSSAPATLASITFVEQNPGAVAAGPGGTVGVELTAVPTSATLPDGTNVPMWGYRCANSLACTPLNPVAAASGSWSPVVITAMAGQTLAIDLTNSLSFANGNSVPTSLVMVGQLGGGLGTGFTTTPSPTHAPQGATWFAAGSPDVVGITGITVVNAGSGYLTPPAVTLTGGSGAAGATATATIDATTGAVTGITVTGGAGYATPPLVTIAPPPASGTLATAVAVVSTATAGTGNATFTPPSQGPRVQSFGTEVLAGTTTRLTWTNLKPGTYLIESGTHPSIQGPMGLYGILVVTTAPAAATATTTAAAGCAYPGATAGTCALPYDADVPMLLSEIDAVQNAAVSAAVNTAGFSETRVWSGQPGMCGDPAATGVYNTCYPPAVNYDPRYFLVNGATFDRTNIGGSTFPALASGATSISGNVLLRFVNAGSRMHVPSIVNAAMNIYAEDGNLLPGNARKQNEVFLAAGKTQDVALQLVATPPAAYPKAAYPIFDRSLSLSTNSAHDGGMQAYLAVAGGTPAATPLTALTSANSVATTFYCASGQTLAVTDATKGLIGGVLGANGVTLGTAPAFTGQVTAANVAVNPDGTFTYSPPATGACAGTFTYLVNGATPGKATIAECDSITQAGTCALGRVTARPDSYTSMVGAITGHPAVLHIAPPGVLVNDTDTTGHPLSVDLTSAPTACGSGCTVSVLADGSFTATIAAGGTGPYTFQYKAKNSQGVLSVAATVSVSVPAASNIQVTLIDGPTGLPISDATLANQPDDYRWTIEEDRTFYVDPACQINSTDPSLRPASCPPLPVQSLGYNFHTASMPVVATGCTGPVSCEAGQTLLGAPTACDQGNGSCGAVDATTKGKVALFPGQVPLDPNKRYFLTVAPANGINPTINDQGGPITDPVTGKSRPFSTGDSLGHGDCTGFAAAIAPTANCGHSLGGIQVSGATVAANNASTVANQFNVVLTRSPLPTAQISAFIFEDDYPVNGEHDASGISVSGPAPYEAGLDKFNIVLFDQAGGLGDATGQPTYDMFNQPLNNSLSGWIDPLTGYNACPLTRADGNLIGMIPVCPKFEDGNDAAGNPVPSPLVGQAVINNLYPGLYEVQAFPGADRIALGEEWLQTNTLDGAKPHEAFIKPGEPKQFQEFGPGGFHVSIGFANPKIINDRRTMSGGPCDPAGPGACTQNLYGWVQGMHMARTPDQRTYASGDNTMYAFTQCYVAVSAPDSYDFAFAKCDQDGKFEFSAANGNGPLPAGDYKLTVFDQWNDIMLDGLVNPVCIGTHTYTVDNTVTGAPAPCVATGSAPGSSSGNRIVFPVTQWRTNLYTRTFIDVNGDGVSNIDANGSPTEPGLALVNTNIRYRDGSFGFFNNTDLNGFAGWNEIFPFMNWLVAETSSTRYKQTGTHIVYDAGGPVDGEAGGGSSAIADHLANTVERTPLPTALRVPGAYYCDLTQTADCAGASIAAGPYGAGTTGAPGAASSTTNPLSSGVIIPPQTFGPSMAFQSLLGQSVFMEFGMRPMKAGENGGIQGHVIYASTRPFDDPQLLLQLSWEPGVANVRVNLYQESADTNGQPTLKLVDTTTTTSWDDFAQGFRRDANGALISTQYTYTDAANVTKTVTGYVPNMNCPGQDATSPFFQTLRGSTQWLDQSNPKTPLAADSLFKCYDGWSQLNQVQPAPYDGKYTFPSVVALDKTTGRPAGVGKAVDPTKTAADGTNCTICTANPVDGWPMLPNGKYVVEVIVPKGYDLVKEEDKNILMGDIYVAPVTVQFPGVGGNIFIMPDQAAVGAAYNKNNPLNQTLDLGSKTFPRHEGDTGSIETYWPCVGEKRTVPDFNSLFPGAGQNAPFAGATRNLCDRKEVTLEDQSTALAKFYVFTPAHIAGHFTGTITNDFASEFDPFSPQFGEKFGPPNLPVGLRDYTGHEMVRVYSDQWGIYNGMYYSSWEVNPPNPTGYAPQMAIACMNDAGKIPPRNALGQYIDPAAPNVALAAPVSEDKWITDPSYNPAYSNFCYEQPFMPGFTTYMDTPVIPTQGFADGYNLPDSEYPDGTPAVLSVVSSAAPGPWVQPASTAASASVTFTVSGINRCQAAPGTCNNPASLTFPLGTVTCTPDGVNGPNCSSSNATPPNRGTIVANYIRANIATLMGAGYTAGGTDNQVIVTASATGPSPNGTDVVLATSNVNSPNLPVQLSGGADAATASMQLTITALGDKWVQNADFSGPGATTPPYNQKTVKRHYGFGNSRGSGSAVLIGDNGVTRALTGLSWSDTTITGTVPDNLPPCRVQQRGAPVSFCGQLVITRGNGQRSIDAITVTAGGSAPWVVTPLAVTAPAGKSVKDYASSFGRLPTKNGGTSDPIQVAVDSATPGDIILVTPGSYRERVIMWKPVRLQGVGSGSTVIDADAHPSDALFPWRRQLNCTFGLSVNGVPFNVGSDTAESVFDPTGTGYKCPQEMFLTGDRQPFEPIVNYDAAGNANLGQVIIEPTLMGAYEGSGVTVVGRGVRAPDNSVDFWGIQASLLAAAAGAYADGSVYLGNSGPDCAIQANPNGGDPDATAVGAGATGLRGRDYGMSNYKCNPSSIDGFSITNSSQGGGGVFIHSWGHNLNVGNNRVYGNHGTLSGGISVGNGETPGSYSNDGTLCGIGIAAPAPLCPPIPAGTLLNELIPLGLDINVRVHNNAVYNNASLGDALFSATPSGAGGITISAGSDNYRADHNWIAGNLTSGDGGGMAHSGQSFNGSIDHNFVLYNQSTNPTLPTSGGGLDVIGSNQPRLLNGVECGNTNDLDCPPGLGDGTGKKLVIDSNLILGNSAESGTGGGLRLQQVNGSEMTALLANPERWYDVTMTNNIIVNNVAGWDGGGVSMEDTLKATIVNNTIASNDTTASAGVLFKSLAAANASSTPPGCDPTTNPLAAQNPNCLNPNAAHIPQPAGLVTQVNSINLRNAIAGAIATGVHTTCPAGYGYAGGSGTGNLTDASCTVVSIPVLTNDLFWQNRAFHVEISGPGTTAGASPTSQQNLVAMVPVLNQDSTGACMAAGLGADLTTPANVMYWDVGVRDDGLQNDGKGVNFNGTLPIQLSLNNSILTPITTPVAVTYNGSNNVYPAASPVVRQYCNGSRVAPENGGRGYLSPPGRSETTGLSTLFVFNGIQPAATVDEGNNWINLTYGPLTPSASCTTVPSATCSTAQSAFTNAGNSMFAASPVGTAFGAYSIGSGSPAINAGTNTVTPTGVAIPATDFFGTNRGANPDIGAVEYAAQANLAVLTVSPNPLAFGNVGVGGTSTLTLSLTNSGTGGANGITLAAFPAGFSRATGAAGGTCGATVGAGNTCTIGVTFTPTLVQAYSGSLAITASVPVAGSPVTLTGAGVGSVRSATVTPGSLSFGRVATGSTSVAQTLTVQNTGNVALAGGTFTFDGGTPVRFARATAAQGGGGTCTATLNAGASCTYNVVFTPVTTLGPITRNLTVAYTGVTVTNSPVTLTGTGFNPRTATVTGGPLAFGTVATFTTSAVQTVTVTNTGTLALAGGTFTFPGGPAFQRAAGANAGTCGATLAVGANCTIGVVFQPTIVNAYNRTLVVTYNAGTTVTGTPVVLTGTAANMLVTPGSLAFGTVTANTTSAAQTLSVRNSTGGARALTVAVTAPFARPAGAAGGTCGASLNTGATCTINVVYSPTTAVASSGTVTITTNGGFTVANSPVALSGTGQ
jgi:hypothetical protein